MISANLHFESSTFTGQRPGPKLIVTGAVHGNETCGTEAIKRVLADIHANRIAIVGGAVTFVPVTNPLAYAKRDRVGDRNLNRNLAPNDKPKDFEDRIANWLCPLLASHDALLDLHSTRATNPPFAMLGPRDNTGTLEPFARHREERDLAVRLGVARFVEGWLDAYAEGVARRRERARAAGLASDPLVDDPRYGIGTTEYLRGVGGYAITLECGQHDDPESPNVAYRAILNALAYLGISDSAPPDVVQGAEHLCLSEVHDRFAEGDRFERQWSSFDALQAGTRIGTRADGTPVIAPQAGYIVFPDNKALPGREWFYLAHAV